MLNRYPVATNSITAPFCPSIPFRPRIQHQQQRTAIFGSGGKKDDDTASSKPNPVLDDFKRKSEADPTPAQQPQQRPAAGDLSASSIFEDDRRAQQQAEQENLQQDDGAEKKPERDPANMQRVLDPDPNARERWERKKVIQMVRKGGRLNKQQMIKRTEREHLLRTHNMKTSVKKLGMLARQIAGKTIDDAITQMRFSKKKVAQQVLEQLQYARDEAVVMRGMGLGGVEKTEEEAETPTQIQLKDGKRHTVADPSTIYIDQAWVGRGPFGQLPDYRARGRVYVMRTPWTSLSMVLKEEKTRIRLHEEREEKRKKKILDNVWTHLPDRPVQWQRQWYTF
ncbi:39S ribosomal protein L22, mitochondrial [Elasticomyces elasticus]|nr:39S ribosomal protein L22, mitochondrial [Elasticomyces elasticus]